MEPLCGLSRRSSAKFHNQIGALSGKNALDSVKFKTKKGQHYFLAYRICIHFYNIQSTAKLKNAKNMRSLIKCI